MADVKDILLKIGVVTDTDKIEALGQTLDSVLGTYEDNVQLLARYNQQLNDVSASIKALNKIQQTHGKLSANQQAQYAELIKQERELKQGKSELQIVMKNQEKIMQSENGTMKQQSLILGQLRMLYRNLTDEQKAALPQLKTFIDGLDSSLKQADASIGNFQRNVGNYPGLMAQMGQSAASMAASVNPAFGSVTQVVMGMGEQLGLTSGAIGALGGVIGVAAAGFKVFQDAMELTQTVGDAVAIKVAGWEAVYDKFIRMVASADFSNFWEQLRRVKEVGEETADVLDELFERNNALSIAESKASVVQQQNLMIMRDQTKSLEERKAAGEAYMASVMELANVRKDIAEQEFGAKLSNFAAQTGMSEEDVRFYIENYNKYRETANKYAEEEKKAKDFADARRKALRLNLQADADNAEANRQAQVEANRQAYASMSADEQRFIDISSKYNNANDALTADLVQAWAKVEGAIANALQSSQRAATTVNSLTAQQNKTANTAPKVKSKYADVETFEEYQLAIAEDMEKQTNDLLKWLMEEGEKDVAIPQEVLNSAGFRVAKMVREANEWLQNELEAEAPTIARAEDPSKSPFAKALGVTDKELEPIKSHALQAAQQIYGSIQQAAQQASQRRLNDELKAVETEAEQEKAILKAKLDSGVINEKQYEKKIAEIDKNAEAKREEAQKEAFEREKRWNIANALMNMALAITNIWATNKGGAAARIAETVIATASGLAQIATISAQKYARGGELHGASHAQGGIKGNIQGHNIELEGDEVVINKRSSRKYRSLLSYINSDNGWGVDFAGVRGRGGYRPQLKYARGGVLGSYDFSPASVPQASILQKQMERQVEQTESLIAATNRRIDRLQVQVNISDIEGASNTKRVHINRAKL